MTSPSVPVVLTWIRLVRAHNAAMTQIADALKSAAMPPPEWYDVLLELDRGGALRPRDLQARLLLAQYNLSRLLDRMVSAGLVIRTPCTGDKRGHLVDLTAEGRALRAQMWPVYAAAIEDALGARLSGQEAATLAHLLGRLTAA